MEDINDLVLGQDPILGQRDGQLNSHFLPIASGIPTEFDVEAKRSWFTAKGSVRSALEGQSWTAGKLSIGSEYIALVTPERTDELKPYSLTWRNPTEFVLSGTNRQLEIGRITVSFQTEAQTKNAASAIIASGRVKEWESEPPSPQVPVEIRAEALIGPFFLLLPIWYCIVIVTSFYVPDTVQLILGGVMVGVLYWIFRTILDRQMRAGPVTAWFRPRLVKAQLYVDEGDLVVNAFGREEAFLVTRIFWKSDRIFKAVAGKTVFELIFHNPDDATRIASMVRINSLG